MKSPSSVVKRITPSPSPAIQLVGKSLVTTLAVQGLDRVRTTQQIAPVDRVLSSVDEEGAQLCMEDRGTRYTSLHEDL